MKSKCIKIDLRKILIEKEYFNFQRAYFKEYFTCKRNILRILSKWSNYNHDQSEHFRFIYSPTKEGKTELIKTNLTYSLGFMGLYNI